MSNADDWRREFDRLAKEIDEQVVQFERRVVLDLFTVVNVGNPVGNPTIWKKPRKGYVGGQSRRNWRLSLTRGGAVVAGTDPSPMGKEDPAAKSAVENFLINLKAPTSLWLSNPMPYIDRLEQGWSRQQPTGWLLKAVYAVAQKYKLRVI